MRLLQIVKTSEGAEWAALQAAELVKLGVEVHVALPDLQGRTVRKWKDAGAILHTAATDIHPRHPWALPATLRGLRDLVGSIQPALIHSHFVSSTILLRLALGAQSPIPRLFQVPGPLHLEHPFWRKLEISTAGPQDSWIASSRCILGHYQEAGISPERLYLSYYGTRIETGPTGKTGLLRKRYGIDKNQKIVGNANFIYPPKWYLGQSRGLKAHEDVIDALGMVLRHRSDVTGILIGGSFMKGSWYEKRLRDRAHAAGGDRIIMTGYMPAEEVRQVWPEFDIAVHVPTSENCGGVVEPMLAGVPVIASRVGGLPELVIDGLTGTTVPPRQPGELARQIQCALSSRERCLALAGNGRDLVTQTFSVERTSREVLDIYSHVLNMRDERPVPFDPASVLVHAAAA
jgi:glycosyltransferase involved in cell wall biosynthesis